MRKKVIPIQTSKSKLISLGFNISSVGVHASRTIMVDELRLLLTEVTSLTASVNDYYTAIVDKNCLLKRSLSNRTITYTKLKILYGLDNKLCLFRILNLLFRKDPSSLGLLAYMCAYNHDLIIRELSPFILHRNIGEHLSKFQVAEQLSKIYSNKYSQITYESIAKNINSTWTQAGYLSGKNVKQRTSLQTTPASVTYALALGYIMGYRGWSLFESEFIQCLDSPLSNIVMLAEEASRKGWIYMKRIGDVVDISFDYLLNKEEMELINE